MSTSNAVPAVKFHHGNLRRALIDATITLIERDGPSAVSLREAARTANVSHNAPYRHFPTRDALLAAVATEGFDQLRCALEKTQQTSGDLIALGQAYLEFASRNPGIFRLMFSSGLDRSVHPELVMAGRKAMSLLLSEVGQNKIDKEGGDIAMGAWALVHGLAHLHVDGQLSPELMDRYTGGDLLKSVTPRDWLEPTARGKG